MAYAFRRNPSRCCAARMDIEHPVQGIGNVFWTAVVVARRRNVVSHDHVDSSFCKRSFFYCIIWSSHFHPFVDLGSLPFEFARIVSCAMPHLRISNASKHQGSLETSKGIRPLPLALVLLVILWFWTWWLFGMRMVSLRPHCHHPIQRQFVRRSLPCRTEPTFWCRPLERNGDGTCP